MRNCPRIIICICACLLLVGAPWRHAEAASIVLDQQILATGGGFGSSGLAQTFTVGIAGNLVGVDVAAWSDANASLYVFGTTAGVPDVTKQLMSGVVSIPDSARDIVSHFQPTIFFAPIAVSVGDQLAIALVLGPGGAIIAWTASGTPYSGGALFNIPDGVPANRFVNLDGDAGLRTYVDIAAAPVPEPSTVSLVGLGLVSALWRWRRKTRLVRLPFGSS